MTTIRITAEQAAEAITAAARRGTIAAMTRLAHGGLFHDVYTMDLVQSTLSRATLCAHTPGPFGYDLAVLEGGRVTHYDVPMPRISTADEFMAQYGGTLLLVLEDGAADVTYTADMQAKFREAHAALEAVLWPNGEVR